MQGRQRVLRFLRGEPVDRRPFMPITMMFATDQIGAKYRDYATDHRVLVAAQVRTAEAFDIDHVSCISDPGREAHDCGARVRFFDDQPPAIEEDDTLLADKSRLLKLHAPDPHRKGSRMHDRVMAAALFKQQVGGQRLIEGWIEGPCAQGADLRGLMPLMLDFYDDPDFVRDLFAFAVEMELRFARAQVEAGAELMGIGDAAACLIGPDLYHDFVWPYEKQLIDGVRAMGVPVRLHVCGNTTAILPSLARLECDIVDVDYLASLQTAREAMGGRQVLLGNIEPAGVLRRGAPPEVLEATAGCLRQSGPRHIVGAGCEVPRDTPAQNLHAMRRAAEAELSPTKE